MSTIAQTPTPMAITAITRAAGATRRDGVGDAGWECVIPRSEMVEAHSRRCVSPTYRNAQL